MDSKDVMVLTRCAIHNLSHDCEVCPCCEVGDDPFAVNEPIVERVHEVIGICCWCKGDGHTRLDDKVFCYPCAYDYVN